MSNLISRSALMKEVEKFFCDSKALTNDVLSLVCLIPAVDAVEVVRCKDCIYSEDAYECNGFLICPASNMEITDNDFCSCGERKDGDGNVGV